MWDLSIRHTLFHHSHIILYGHSDLSPGTALGTSCMLMSTSQTLQAMAVTCKYLYIYHRRDNKSYPEYTQGSSQQTFEI